MFLLHAHPTVGEQSGQFASLLSTENIVIFL